MDVFNPPETLETPVVEPVVDKRLKDKDDYITRLEQQAADMREELKKVSDAATQLETLRNELKSLKEQRTTIQPRENTTPALTEVDIKTLVQKTITEAEANKSTSQNIKEANDALVRHFNGDLQKAGESVVTKARELNVSVDFLREVAAKSPTAFLDVMGKIKESVVEDTFIKSSVNTEALGKSNNVVAKEGTKPWFDNLRKTNPKEYWSPHTQQRLFDAAKRGTYA